MPHIPLKYSNTHVRNAGVILRDWVNGRREFVLGDREVEWALDVLDNFRAAHEYPLSKATMGVRSMVDTVGAPHDVSQRLKRHVSIMNKLGRDPSMKLHNMQDIAECRAVVDTIDQVRAIESRPALQNRIVRRDDYIEKPRDSGYRGLHLIVQYDRRGEVQLRTRVQHEWATTVERVGGRINADLKSGRGPPEVLAFFEAVSRAMGIEERGEEVAKSLIEEIRLLRSKAETIMNEGE